MRIRRRILITFSGSRLAEALAWLTMLAVSVLCPAVGMFILPAALVWVLGAFKNLDRFTRGVYCLLFGVSCWAWLPWLTRYAPVSLTSLIRVTVLAAAIAVAASAVSRRAAPPAPPNSRTSTRRTHKLVLVLALGLLMLARFLPCIGQNVPPGSDMTMHAYNARLIIDNDGIPTTQRPILPIDSFSEYPIGFALLVASTSLTSDMGLPQSAIVWSCLTFVCATLGLFLLLRVWFQPALAMVGAVFATLLTASPQWYVKWGGSPTVLSLAFILAAFSLYLSLNKNRGILVLLVQAAFWSGALITHSIPFAGASYLVFVFSLCFLVFKAFRKQLGAIKGTAGRAAIVLLLALLMAAPFPIGASPQISDHEVHWVRSWIQERGLPWDGSISDSLITIPQYLASVFRYHILVLCLLGVFLSTLAWRTRLAIFLASMAVVGLIVNSRYWVLPFSYALYPERMALLLLAPLAIILTGLVEWVLSRAEHWRAALNRLSSDSILGRVSRRTPMLCAFPAMAVVLLTLLPILSGSGLPSPISSRCCILASIAPLVLVQLWLFRRQKQCACAAIGFSIIVVAGCLAGGYCLVNYYEYYARPVIEAPFLTQDDLDAFEWIKQNTRAEDVILNITDGPPLWIPALCARRIMMPHLNPLYIDELNAGNEGVEPSYLFLGSRSLPPNVYGIPVESIPNSPFWIEVASFGRARVYARRDLRAQISISGPLVGPTE